MPIYNYREPGAYSTIIPNPGIFTFINLPTVPCIVGKANQGTYDPKLFFNQDDVVREYGDSGVDNPLVLGAEICFQHGAKSLYCVRLLSEASTAATVDSEAVTSGALIDQYIVFQDVDSEDHGWNNPVTATIVNTASSSTSVENAALIAYSINSTYGITVTAHDNLDGTYTLTNKVPGAQHGLRIVAVSNPISLGISINSSPYPRGTDGTIHANDFYFAYKRISNIRTNVIVPITEGFAWTDISTIRNLTMDHVAAMSTHDERMERIGIVSGPINEGLFGGASVISDIIAATKANAEHFLTYNERYAQRMVYVAPTSVFRFDPINNLTLVLDGSFLAAALAGILAAYDAAEPATRKPLTGFLGLGLSLSRSDMNNMASSGVTVIQNERGRLRIRHGLTTDTTSPDTQEISVVRLVDYTAEVVRNTLEAMYVGKKLLRTSTDEIAATTNVLLKKLIEDRIIYNARNIRAKIDDVEPRQVNVRFDLRPIYPLNWIEITIFLYDKE